MKIIITESTKKAKTIKKFLKDKNITVIASKGHIVDLPKKEFGVYLKNENSIEIKYIPINRRFLSFIKRIKNKAKEIIIATDPDREGEFIAWSIVEFAKIKNYSRVRFYEISQRAILESLKNKEKLNENLVRSQKTRRLLDRIIGYTLSPILWRKKIGESAGRVQSAALRLIVEREEEIKKFVPDIFFKLEVSFGDFKAYLFKKNKDKFNKEDLKTLEEIKKEVEKTEFVLEEIIKEKEYIKKPTPLDTALLQRVTSLKYRYPSPFTMKLAQSLYEKGYITYHRTDSFRLSEEFLEKLKLYLKDYFEKPRTTKSKFSQEAHEAIRPVYLTKDLPLSIYEKKLYDLIFDFTLASSSKDAVVEKTIFILKPINKDLEFKAEGENLIFDGFLRFYPFKIKFNPLPNIEKGTRLKPKSVKILELKTKPPSRYTEASLIKKLKELGIGRPSTYAEIIRILLKRGYVIKEKNYLKPTEKGINVINFLKNNFKEIIDLKFTANMENILDEIAKGNKDYEKFVIDFWKFLKSLL